MPRLVLPSQKYKKNYLSGLAEFQKEGLLLNIPYKAAAADFGKYVRQTREKARGLHLPAGFVPQTEYWLVDSKNYLGTVRIRHRLNNVLMQVGGHIGYHIRPSQRQKGYGKKILKLVLPKAKKLGLKKVLLTCDETNIASRKIIEANGGRFKNRVSNGRGRPRRLRFWIDIA